MRIGNPTTTTVHFAMKFLNYFGLLMEHGEGGGGEGGVQKMQNLVGNWQKSFVLALTSHSGQSKHFRGEKYLVHGYV